MWPSLQVLSFCLDSVKSFGRSFSRNISKLSAPAFPLSACLELLRISSIIGALREIGEPARKAMIVDLAKPELRARSVGLCYLLRSFAITPAAAIGAMLWKFAPQTPFVIAGMF